MRINLSSSTVHSGAGVASLLCAEYFLDRPRITSFASIYLEIQGAQQIIQNSAEMLSKPLSVPISYALQH